VLRQLDGFVGKRSHLAWEFKAMKPAAAHD
jgi:hypothetical protein